VNPQNLWNDSAIIIYAFVFVFVVILFFMILERREEKIKASKVVAFIRKYSLIFGVAFLVIGLIIWTPILDGSETILGYRGQEMQDGIVVILDTAYFSPQFFMHTLFGLSMLIIGAVIIAPNLFRGIEKLIRGVRRWRTKP
jgi:hypothetical protein